MWLAHNISETRLQTLYHGVQSAYVGVNLRRDMRLFICTYNAFRVLGRDDFLP